MTINFHKEHLDLKDPLPTSYGIVTGADNGYIQIKSDNYCGYGEAVPIKRYGENINNVISCFEIFNNYFGSDSWAIEEITRTFDKYEINSAAARSAIIMALYDINCKKLNIPLYQYLGLSGLKTPYTSYTIGVDTPENVVKKLEEAKDYPIIKLKIGSKNDIEAIKAIREVSDVDIRVDANAGWTPKQAVEMIDILSQYNIQFVEQPVAADDYEGLKFVREHSDIPIFADESCRTIKDIPLLSDCVDGVNIKLAKCGGIYEAIKMIHTAKAHGLKVMIGCFLESSLAASAAAQLAYLTDYADLDSILFIKQDPYIGITIENGKIIVPDTPGLGVTLQTC